MPKHVKKSTHFEYDICLSFAGEDRTYVEKVADVLRQAGVRVFYDEYKRAELWGKDLYTHLDDIYQNAAMYCILFVSRSYARKLWTNHERQSAQARAFRENQEYILPARFDNTKIPGLRSTVGYINLQVTSPKELADLIREKIGDRPQEEYFPPIPDRLFARLRAKTERAQDRIHVQALVFFEALQRMSPDERLVVTTAFRRGCIGELPDNVHVDLDLLRRYTGFPVAKLKRLLGGLRSLGFYCSLRDAHGCEDTIGGSELIVVTWDHLLDMSSKKATLIAREIIVGATDDYCEDCGMQALQRLDFSQLASATMSEEQHE